MRTFGAIPLRHHEIVPQQHPVERAGGRHQLLAVLGENHMVDQFVDGRVLDADQVAAAFAARGFRAPEIALLVARRVGLGEIADDDVVVEAVQPPCILRAVDHA